MNTPDVIALVSVVIAGLSVLIASLQYLDNRRKKKSEGEVIAQHRERLRTAEAAAELAARTADMLIQRAKSEDVTNLEIQNVARVLRGSLLVLAKQLRDEQSGASVDSGNDSGDSLLSGGRPRRSRRRRGAAD